MRHTMQMCSISRAQGCAMCLTQGCAGSHTHRDVHCAGSHTHTQGCAGHHTHRDVQDLTHAQGCAGHLHMAWGMLYHVVQLQYLKT